jgi:gliding motility-associated-like protein
MKMNNPYPSFDDQLREQLSSLNPEVPEGVWEAMESSLDALNESLQFDSAIRESVDQLNIPAPEGVFQAVQSQIGSGVVGSGLSIAGKWILGSVLAGMVATSVWFFVDQAQDKEEVAVVSERNEVPVEMEKGKTPGQPLENGAPENTPSIQGSGTHPTNGAGIAGTVTEQSPNGQPLNSAQPPVAPAPQNIQNPQPQAQPKPQPKPQPQPAFGFSASDTMLCAGQVYTLFFINADNCVYDIVINGRTVGSGKKGTESFKYEATETGLYHVECRLRKGEMTWKKTQFLNVNPLPEVRLNKTDLGEGRYACEAGNGINTSWYLDGGKANGTIQLYDALPRDHRMSAHVTNEFGCTDSASLGFRNNVVFEVKEPNIPNVFSPNGDGKNDVYSIEIEGATHYQIYIFNSDSKVVFESQDPKAAWDGKDKFKQNRIEAGMYTCIIDYALAGGEIKRVTRKIELIKE